jgi:hypothetical protein
LSLGVTLSFTNLIIVSTILLFILLLAFFVFGPKRYLPSTEARSEAPRTRKIVDLLGVSSLVSTLLLLLFSFALREVGWFVLRLMSLFLIILYAYFRPQSKVTIVYLIVNVAAASLSPMISLGFPAGEADQRVHIIATNMIITNGHVYNIQLYPLEDQYYAVFPAMDFLISGLSLSTGLNSLLSLAILQLVLPVVAAISIIYVSRILTRDYLAATIAISILLATDRLAIWFLIPENLSLFYAMIAFLPLAAFMINPSKTYLFLILTFVTFANIAHASFGGLFVISFPLIALFFWWRKIGYMSEVITASVAVVTVLLSYWTIWNITTSWDLDYNLCCNPFSMPSRGGASHILQVNSLY